MDTNTEGMQMVFHVPTFKSIIDWLETIRLICLYCSAPRPSQPFNSNRIPAPGPTTYGHLLQSQAFSNALKDLTEECLFEDPSLRPSLGNLQTRIRAGIAACQNNNLVQDNWYDMEVPDPETV